MHFLINNELELVIYYWSNEWRHLLCNLLFTLCVDIYEEKRKEKM